MKSVVTRCPICTGDLVISRLSCAHCQTTIETGVAFPAVMRLPGDLQRFVLVFLACRGNIRDVEKALGISYPTVCKRLDLVNELLGKPREVKGEAREQAAAPRAAVLERLERGEINAKQAAALLKGR
ncbi:MAG TPA: DUF2089 domain-containing protein [Phycisphaerae bacterium]|nr:DUF2089 domain-containing protein [Phycisphaerae bacterium]